MRHHEENLRIYSASCPDNQVVYFSCKVRALCFVSLVVFTTGKYGDFRNKAKCLYLIIPNYGGYCQASGTGDGDGNRKVSNQCLYLFRPGVGLGVMDG